MPGSVILDFACILFPELGCAKVDLKTQDIHYQNKQSRLTSCKYLIWQPNSCHCELSWTSPSIQVLKQPQAYSLYHQCMTASCICVRTLDN